MDGGGKHLTAILLVGCGALGALVFSRRPQPVDSAPRTESAADALVRRTTPPPIALDLTYDSSAPPAAGLVGHDAGSKFDAARPAAPVDARPQARLSGQFPPPPLERTSPLGGAAVHEFGAARADGVDPGRTPLNNLLHAPQLPERFPAAPPAATENLTPLPAAPSRAAGDGTARLTFGAPQPEAARMTPISSTGVPAVAAGRTTSADVGPTTGAATAPAEQPRRFTPVKRHTVRDGDTLAALAARYYGDATLAQALFEANRGVLRSAELLPIGVVLTIPARELSASATTGGQVETAPAPAARLVPKLEFNGVGAPPVAGP